MLTGAACDPETRPRPSAEEPTEAEAFEKVERVKPPATKVDLSKKHLKGCVYDSPVDPASLNGVYFGPQELVEDQLETSRSLEMATPETVEMLPPKAFADAFTRAGTELPRSDAVITRSLSWALGLAPFGLDVAEFLKGEGSGLVAGFYNQKQDSVYVERKGKLDSELVVLAHEFAHAAADQAFGLPKTAPENIFDDKDLASDSLVEGDAMLAELRFISRLAAPKKVAKAIDAQLSFGSRFRKDRQSGVPYLLLDQVAFPYQWGAAFVCSVFKERGWGGVDRAYDSPPKTTAQIMYPQRYLRKERAKSTPGFRDPPGEFRVTAAGELGAAHLKAMFEAPGDKEKKALTKPYSRAAAWAGGRYEVWEHKNRHQDYVVGVSLREHEDYPGLLCSSMHEWYRTAFPTADRKLVGDRTIEYFDYDQSAIVSCSGSAVLLGFGRSPEQARMPLRTG